MKTIRVALAGNPNCGKSTIFNALTGSRQHVGNWPGKTIARKEGYVTVGDVTLQIVDLPGAYSLSPYSPEEKIARDYIVEQKPDVVVNVLDATNLERNLYLTTQILETGAPLILVLNMWDRLTRRGYRLDIEKLSQRLGGAIVLPAVASQGKGLGQLRQAIISTAQESDGAQNSGEEPTYGSNGSGIRFPRTVRGCH
ncbi:MAG TPA: FeoB small GTPase domain-containing protein [Candidatus Sulfomarinibacteraceae bacterium]|nr:FeoB small GTPase domain-containing protein [Candidatus Sulfomarinibacteraceae bacterium]